MPNGLPKSQSKQSLINVQNVRRFLQHFGEAQGQPRCPELFKRDRNTGQFVHAGKEIHEAVAVLRTQPAADVKIEPPVSPDSTTSACVQGFKLSQVSNVNDLRPKIEGAEYHHTDNVNDIQDQKHGEDGDEEDPSQDSNDVEGECLVEHRRHPVRADQVEHFTKVVFRFGIQQKGCKKVLQYWLRKCHPKKQATHPYNGGQKHGWDDEENKGEHTAPPYWPKQKGWLHAEENKSCRHKEPDHLKKGERLVLCCHLLIQGKVGEFDFSVDLLEESTKDLTETHAEHFPSEAGEHLADIYELRRHQIRFENGEIDGDSTIMILMPRKAKVYDIQATAKLRQQLSKKSRATILASQPDTAFDGYGPKPRHVKTETETTISPSSSLHDAMSTTEQSADDDDDDEDMTTEPCSSATSPMALDTQLDTGSATSFGHASYASSCRSASHDVSMEYHPVIKTEEQRFSQIPWSCSNAGMQTDMSLASNSAYPTPQQALQNHAFDPRNYYLGPSTAFSTLPGSQNAGLASGIPRLGSSGYGENDMFDPWPLRADGFPNGGSQNAFPPPDGSQISPYDPSQINQGRFEHLRQDPAWFETYCDRPDDRSNMSYNDMLDTQMFCPNQLHHDNRSTAAERPQSYTTGDWPSSAQV